MRGIRDIENVGNVRTMNSVGARSIPKVQRSSYLDLYVAKREKDRLEKEISIIDKRKRIAKRLLRDINMRIQALQNGVANQPVPKAEPTTKSRRVKTMSIRY